MEVAALAAAAATARLSAVAPPRRRARFHPPLLNPLPSSPQKIPDPKVVERPSRMMAAAEEGCEPGVHPTHGDEGQEEGPELERWSARVATLQSTNRTAKVAARASTAVEREASPKVCCDGEGLRAMQGGAKSRKRKSPCSSIGMFRSPLSRMMLSPRLRISFAPSPRTSSPFLGHGTSPSATTYGGRRVLTEIDPNTLPDLNVEPEEPELEEVNTELEEELNAEPQELEEANEGIGSS